MVDIQKIYEQAESLAKEAEIISSNLADHNPGLQKKNVPLETIQHDIASLTRDYSILYSEIGEKIRNEIL